MWLMTDSRDGLCKQGSVAEYYTPKNALIV